MILVDTCETINESMIQVIFQLCIILATMHSKPITTLQILVVTISLLMASKGPAEDFLASKMRRLKQKQGKDNVDAEGTGDKLIVKELLLKPKDTDVATDGEAVQTEEIQEELVNEEVESRHLVTCLCLTTKINDYHEMDFPEKLPMIGMCFLPFLSVFNEKKLKFLFPS